MLHHLPDLPEKVRVLLLAVGELQSSIGRFSHYGVHRLRNRRDVGCVGGWRRDGIEVRRVPDAKTAPVLEL